MIRIGHLLPSYRFIFVINGSILTDTIQSYHLSKEYLVQGGSECPPPHKVLPSRENWGTPNVSTIHILYWELVLWKKIQNFHNFFKKFFGHTSHTKRFFCTFGPKVTYSYILGGQHVHLTPKKCFLEVYSQSVCTLISWSPYKVGLSLILGSKCTASKD